MMIVNEFNTDKGLYIFEFDNFDTDFHSHPAIEIIEAKKGTFTLCTENAQHHGLLFAVIQANQKHKLSSINCALKVTMIEHHHQLVKDLLFQNNININHGFYFQNNLPDKKNITRKIVQTIKNNPEIVEYDERILTTINYINQNNLEYHQMMKTLKEVTNLSESRLSHLFKTNLGISLKKYLVWAKLKSTIKLHLNEQDDLFSSLIKSGFYDQPHFSKSFKAMLGVKASKAYNSRTLQVLNTIAS